MDKSISQQSGAMLFSDYEAQVVETDVIPRADFNTIQLGLYGEVGGIMSAAKKHVREGSAYPGFRTAAEEEFGDTLWYFAALCRRAEVALDDVFTDATSGDRYKTLGAAIDLPQGNVAHIAVPVGKETLDATLFNLGRAATSLLGEVPGRQELRVFAEHYVAALHAAKLSFAEVGRANIRKARGAFIAPDASQLVDFDMEFGPEEQIPRAFRIRVDQRGSARSYLRLNDVFIGDPLTDNISDADGYRFHDVFHFAHAAILHWSPVTRALLKIKRKSRPEYDENQDGGRAIVVEEGLTAWIFAQAKELNYFDGQQRVSLGLLKTIQEFVGGYEVELCPPKLWERAILEGYSVFRQIREAEGGWIVGDRAARTLSYEPLKI